MNTHLYENSDPTAFDSNCAVCGGKHRDSVHGPTDAAREMKIAQTIAQQIGQRAFLMMGTKHKVGDGKSLSFDIHGCREYSKVRVTLEPSDTYTLEFFKFRSFQITRHHTVDNVYADGLKQCIEHNTGLLLSL